jgi:hypothetical protein
MNECDHKLVPIVYGYMYGHAFASINNNESIYGGEKKTATSPEWFCMRCLEEIYLD